MSINNETHEKFHDFPYKIESVCKETSDELLRYFHGERSGFVKVGPEGYFFPNKYKEDAVHYYNFQARHDDIWITTFPRSGTTWTQELIWLIANDLDFETARSKYLTQRFPFFEFSTFIHPDVKAELFNENADNEENQKFIEAIARPGYETLAKFTDRRFIKTHFPFSLMPPSVMAKQCKVIYVARNPKDVAVSYYHLNRLYKTQGYVGNFNRYWDYFEKGLNPWMPYFSHIKEGWSNRHHSNVLFMFYEDMNVDFPKTIEKVATFLDKTLNAIQIENLSNYLHINHFKQNVSVNGEEMRNVKILNKGEAGFVRNGEICKKQKEFTDELNAKAEKWIEDNLKDTDLKFPLIK